VYAEIVHTPLHAAVPSQPAR